MENVYAYQIVKSIVKLSLDMGVFCLAAVTILPIRNENYYNTDNLLNYVRIDYLNMPLKFADTNAARACINICTKHVYAPISRLVNELQLSGCITNCICTFIGRIDPNMIC